MLNRVTARDTDYHFNLGSPSTRSRIPDQPLSDRARQCGSRITTSQPAAACGRGVDDRRHQRESFAWTTDWYCMEMDLLHLLHSITMHLRTHPRAYAPPRHA